MSLNVIGLISGGKDSLFSLAHCVENGHKIVALANLYPAGKGDVAAKEEGDDDLNSFMYQTVGYSMIPLYAEALDLPLYRRETTGSAVQKSRNYEELKYEKLSSKQMDETEDMYLLLKDVLEKHPEANALNAGAILSTYQRTRVESVASRLGLTPLAYLWQYPALPPPPERGMDSLTGLLDDMYVAGCDARIIKLASGGIRENCIFANVAHPSTTARLVNDLSRFYAGPGQEYELRGAVLGEGGEYETLALDGPSSLWKKKINVELRESTTIDGVAYARCTEKGLTLKDPNTYTCIPGIAVFDDRFATLSRLRGQISATQVDESISVQKISCDTFSLHEQSCQAGNTLYVANVTAQGATITDQFTTILRKLFGHSTSSASAPDSTLPPRYKRDNITSTLLLVDKIESFAAINQVYSQDLWPPHRSIPPARVTLATELPPGVHVSLSLVFDSGTMHPKSDKRDGLHVQSRSYWAPANIGPYSQAVSYSPDLSYELKTVCMAGQIPLIPSSMQLANEVFFKQAILALQHLWRVGQERKVDVWQGAGVAYLSKSTERKTYPSSGYVSLSAYERAREAGAAWLLAHEIDEKGQKYQFPGQDMNASDGESEEDIDVWHIHQNRGIPTKITIGSHLHALPSTMFLPRPAFIAAEVLELPRYASIEWWSTGLSGLMQPKSHRRPTMAGFNKLIGKGCLIKGMVVRHPEDNNSNDSEENADFNQTEGGDDQHEDSIHVFFALLCDIEVDPAHITEVVNNLASVLTQDLDLDASSSVFEMTASHTFLNLFAPAAIQRTITSLELFNSSIIVPSRHVWTSEDVQNGTIQSSAGMPSLPDLTELASVHILRFTVR